MSGILILIVFVVGALAAVAFLLYGRASSRKPGRVRPDAPPDPEERRSARGEGRED